MEIDLSPVRSHEISAVMQLHAALLPISYPRSFFLQLLLQPTRLCLVARSGSDGDLVAFISAAMHPGQRLEILTLGVLPLFQQHRLATRLVYAVIDALTSKAAAVTTVFAQVSASNSSAQEFYRHMGMLPSGDVIRDMYRTLPCGSRDAYIVSRRIDTRARDALIRL
ncbi:acyl-CoA N-acyltransferase [Mycena albidolilacea]|uniref:N-alpha-acetyltransferase 60 n=1 Tax=Mycena albidolilacea TaxID=1033008 RepID=A0AAD7A636_9AGAR|nr:acyl-CoA N-acyltransferase [Mycena albidolilacea]